MATTDTTVSEMHESGGAHPSGGTALVVTVLLAAAAVQIAGVEALRQVFVDSVRGQWLDAAALAGHTIGEGYVEGTVDSVLNAVTVLSLLAVTVVIGFIALMRRRVAVAVAATLLIVGANVTTQILKYAVERPELGIDMARAGAGNSLPSGHATVAMAVAVALVLVLPSAVRGMAALVGAGYAALTGVATMSAAWHRPSDAVAAFLVVGAWAAIVGALLAILNRRDAVEAPQRRHRLVVATLVVAGGLLLLAAVVAFALTYQAIGVQDPTQLSRVRVLVAYAGGAAGITGAAGLVMAMVVAAVHREVPDRA